MQDYFDAVCGVLLAFHEVIGIVGSRPYAGQVIELRNVGDRCNACHVPRAEKVAAAEGGRQEQHGRVGIFHITTNIGKISYFSSMADQEIIKHTKAIIELSADKKKPWRHRLREIIGEILIIVDPAGDRQRAELGINDICFLDDVEFWENRQETGAVGVHGVQFVKYAVAVAGIDAVNDIFALYDAAKRREPDHSFHIYGVEAGVIGEIDKQFGAPGFLAIGGEAKRPFGVAF